jgi:hypothetical protein
MFALLPQTVLFIPYKVPNTFITISDNNGFAHQYLQIFSGITDPNHYQKEKQPLSLNALRASTFKGLWIKNISYTTQL